MLNATLSMIIPALNLMDITMFSEIIENIVTKGMPEIQREILFLHVKEKN
mgnify:FL=1